jgi:transcription elongation factor GreA
MPNSRDNLSRRDALLQEIERLESRLVQYSRDVYEQAGTRDPMDAGQFLSERDTMETRIEYLRSQLRIPSDIDLTSDEVSVIGRRFAIRFPDGEESVLEIVVPSEAAPLENRVSVKSPIGKALVGQSSGAVISVNTGRDSYQAEILSID